MHTKGYGASKSETSVNFLRIVFSASIWGAIRMDRKVRRMKLASLRCSYLLLASTPQSVWDPTTMMSMQLRKLWFIDRLYPLIFEIECFQDFHSFFSIRFGLSSLACWPRPRFTAWMHVKILACVYFRRDEHRRQSSLKPKRMQTISSIVTVNSTNDLTKLEVRSARIRQINTHSFYSMVVEVVVPFEAHWSTVW